jgi:tetratricopeptide (TPR) repeat protein
MPHRALLLAALVVAALPPAHAAPASHIDLPYIAQPTAPTCVPAAVAMALGAQGAPVAVLELARAVPVHPGGVSVLDVQEALRARGQRAWLWRGTEAALHTLLAAGVPPVVLTAEPAKHALVVHGWDPDRSRWRVRDPALPELTTMTEAALRVAWEATGRQLLVVSAGELPAGALDAEQTREMREQDARYRAIEWLTRARSHASPNEQALALLTRALAADDTIAEIHNDYAITTCRLGRRDDAIAHLERAVALRPDHEAARANLRRILTGSVPCAAPMPPL